MFSPEQWWIKKWQTRGAYSWRWIKFYPFALGRAVLQGDLLESAQSMVYITLLTLVPLLAVVFALLGGFGLNGVIEPWLRELFQPMGEAGEQIVIYLTEFVSQARAGSLGVVGVVFLFVSIMSLTQKMEVALNRIWQVQDSRKWAVRITNYTGGALLAPLLIAAVMTSMLNIKNIGWLQPFLHKSSVEPIFNLLNSMVPSLTVFLFMTGIYKWMPNCCVRWRAALLGAVCFMALWYPVSQLFSLFIVSSRNYSIIYAGFAVLVFLLLWLYCLWFIFLFSGKVASLSQMPYTLAPKSEQQWYANEQLIIAINLMRYLDDAFANASPPLSAEALSKHLDLSPFKTNYILHRLYESRLISAVNGNMPVRYQLSKARNRYTLLEIYQALRDPADRNRTYISASADIEEAIERVLDRPLQTKRTEHV
ncbi:MAG: YhjD/YihY/BrkB family envelope integrity protein [Cardiobacteriaceae bacterium]|nr:YhjD/YihY/BrkB family envelope integrity protein [Cardiobacteriaceae bacterium]